MSLVEGEEPAGLVSLGDDNRTQVGQPGIEVVIPALEVSDQGEVSGVQVRHGEPARGKILQESQPSRPAKPTAEEVVHLGRCRCRDDQLTSFLTK
jgi:hypothetical protein